MRRIGWPLAVALLLGALALPAAAGSPAALPALGGQVTGAGGRALAGAEVELYAYGAGRVAVTRTDPEGYFTLAAPADGDVFWVRAWSPGHATAEAVWVPGGEQEPFLAFSPAPLGARVAVLALDARTGAPVPGATVALHRPGRGQVAAAAAGPAGQAGLAVPAGGPYLLQVNAPGFIPAQRRLADVPAGTVAAVAVDLEPAAGVVSGQVVESATGAPLAGARVLALRRGQGVAAAATAGADGTFSLDLPAAEYQLQALAPGYQAAATGWFTLAGGRRRDFAGQERLALAPARAAVHGYLLDPDGKPVANAPVTLERQPFGLVAGTTTGADGSFHFGGLPAAAGAVWRVHSPALEGYRRSADSGWLELRPGRTAELALRQERGTGGWTGEGSLRGTVTDPAGRPVAGALVELRRDGVGVVARQETDAGGRFTFAAVRANRGAAPWARAENGYWVDISAPGYFAALAAGAPVDVVMNQEAALAATLYRREVPLSGRALDPDGQPVAGARLRLYAEGVAAPLDAIAGADGAFAFANLDPSRRWRLEAGAPGYLPAAPAYRPEQPEDWLVLPDPAAGAARDITLYRETAAVEGTVTDPEGAPVAGAEVTVIPGAIPTPAGTGPAPAAVPVAASAAAPAAAPARTVVTDAAGRYRVADLPAGAVPLVAATLPDGAGTGALTPAGDLPEVRPLAPGERRSVPLQVAPAGGTVAGSVLDAAGRPVPGARVELRREGEGAVAVAYADARGRYRFDRVPAGPARYQVQAPVPGYSFRNAGTPGLPPLFTVAPGVVRNVHLILVPAATAE